MPPTTRAAWHRLPSTKVTVQVHRHRRGGMPQHPLNHLRISASTQPDRRRGMTKIMNAEARHPGRHCGSTPADRSLPVRLLQRPAFRCVEQPCVRRLARAPAIHDRHQLIDQRNGASSLVLQRVHVQRTAATAGQHRTLQAQARAGSPHPVTDSEARELTPSQPSQRHDRHHIAVAALARLRQRVDLGDSKRLPFPARMAAGRLPCRRRDVVLRGTIPRSHSITCTDSTTNGSDGPDCTGISRHPVPRPVPRLSHRPRLATVGSSP